jgi:hypothetical protein
LDLVKFQSEALGVKAVYKADITVDANAAERMMSRTTRRLDATEDSALSTTDRAIKWVKDLF